MAAYISKLGSNAKNIWREQIPLKYLQETPTDKKICLLLLNRPLKKCVPVLKHLWKSAAIKACADGALNRLKDAFQTEHDSYVPDLVCGDFDSVSTELLESYKKRGADVISRPCQDDTDFTKTLQVMLQKLKEGSQIQEYESIVCMGAFGGRLDHIMSNLNTLILASNMQQKPCYLVSHNQLACLLQPGSHVLHVNTGFEGDWCGLIPLGSTAKHVYTTGLKWNLDGDALSFGSLISTSNTYEGDRPVTIETTDPLLWTMGVKEFK